MNTLFTAHGFELSDTELAQFEQFLSLFMEYNAHTNLSAIRDREGIIEKHFIDSLYGVTMMDQSLWSIDSQHQKPQTKNQKPIKLLDIGSG